jgi:hypothetical protein
MNESLQKSQKVLTTLPRNSPLGRVGSLLAVLVAGYVVLQVSVTTRQRERHMKDQTMPTPFR